MLQLTFTCARLSFFVVDFAGEPQGGIARLILWAALRPLLTTHVTARHVDQSDHAVSGGANFFPQSQVFDELFHFQRGASQFFASLMIACFMVIFMRFRTQGDLNLEFIWGRKGVPFRSFEIHFETFGFIYVLVNFQLTANLIFSFV